MTSVVRQVEDRLPLYPGIEAHGGLRISLKLGGTKKGPGPLTHKKFDAVLFDLGGVLIRLGGVAALKDLTGIITSAEIWERWLSCRWVRSYERGYCQETAFAQGVVDDWGLPITAAEFLERFSPNSSRRPLS
jgi:hypothetical protein